MKNRLLERIETNAKIMLGKPVIKGTRLTVDIILKKIANGYTEKKILKDYPFLTKLDIRAAIAYAANILSFEEEYII